MNVSIKRGTRAHFGAVFSLMQEFAAFQKTPGKLKTSLDQMEREQHIFKCLIAENDEGETVGFASYFYGYYSWSGKALYLDDLYVKEEWRKRGIGLQLLNTLADEAKKEGCYKMRWQVSKWNGAAIQFYRKLGAEIDDTEMNCDLILR